MWSKAEPLATPTLVKNLLTKVEGSEIESELVQVTPNSLGIFKSFDERRVFQIKRAQKFRSPILGGLRGSQKATEA